MTKKMDSCFADLHDEILRAIDEQIGDCSGALRARSKFLKLTSELIASSLESSERLLAWREH